jgi:hypothetical protein
LPFKVPHTELAVCPRQTTICAPQHVLLGLQAEALPV